jgi:hypothetical protein
MLERRAGAAGLANPDGQIGENSTYWGYSSPEQSGPMMARFLLVLRRATVALALCAAMVGLSGAPAHARVWIGFGFPFYGPAFYPPPYYYPPPAYYPPPPVVYAPPQNYSQAPQQNYSQAPSQSGGGQACYAGAYVCPMERPVASGASCYCAGNGGQRVWGQAN